MLLELLFAIGLLPNNGELPRDIFRTADSKLFVTSFIELCKKNYHISLLQVQNLSNRKFFKA